uniref:Uncharacterized protein n=1 Tax=Anopheles albimanus TaxID=7167 RepID=A0A182FBX7_ANOAL
MGSFASKPTIDSLPDELKRLEVLVFDRAKFSESVVFDFEGPIQPMRELLFVDCELDRNRLRGFRTTFPNLEQLQFPRSLQPFHFSDQIKLSY